jgi:mannose-6-phosphate isomerase-like protein (cupin superfamily)
MTSNHETTPKDWGNYTVISESARCKIKRLEVTPGHRLSLQSHRHRSEHWVVISGVAKVTVGDQVLTLTPNQSTFVPALAQHRLENPGHIPLVIIEIQTGEYLGEDDITRYDDDYGRTSLQSSPDML